MTAALMHQRAAGLFKALADPTRVRMLHLLAANRAELCVCEFVDCLQERQYNVSRQLKALEAAGLVAGKKEGRWVYYGLSSAAGATAARVQRLVAALEQDPVLARDQARFRQRMTLRTDGRCRTGIRTRRLAR